MKTKTLQLGHGTIINRDGKSILLNYAGKPIRVSMDGNGALYRQAHQMRMALVNETSVLGKQILIKANL